MSDTKNDSKEVEGCADSACSLSRADLEKMARMRSDFLLRFIEDYSNYDAPFIEKCLDFAKDCAAKTLKENSQKQPPT